MVFCNLKAFEANNKGEDKQFEIQTKNSYVYQPDQLLNCIKRPKRSKKSKNKVKEVIDF